MYHILEKRNNISKHFTIKLKKKKKSTLKIKENAQKTNIIMQEKVFGENLSG